MIEVRSPVAQFFDTDGKPLDNGYIYVGLAGQPAEDYQRYCYWDSDGVLIAPQPFRTINGFPARSGAPAKFYTEASDYSITVRNKKGELVFSSLHANSGVFEELGQDDGASRIGIDGATVLSNPAVDTVEEAIAALRAADVLMQADIAAARVITPVLNLFANPAFLINQRAYVSGSPTGAANQYTLDRIRVVTSGQSLVFGAAIPGVFGNFIIAPANGAEQVIEGSRITGGDYACFWGGSGTITVNGIVRGKREIFTLPAGTNATIRMFGEFTQMQVTRPEMIVATFANGFEYDFDSDLRLCRRYYEYGEYTTFSGNVTTGSTYYARATFSTRKRTSTPVITLTPFGTPSGFGATGTASQTTDAGFTESRTATGTGVGFFQSAWAASSEL